MYKKTTNRWKKILSMLLALNMTFTSSGMTVLADGGVGQAQEFLEESFELQEAEGDLLEAQEHEGHVSSESILLYDDAEHVQVEQAEDHLAGEIHIESMEVFVEEPEETKSEENMQPEAETEKMADEMTDIPVEEAGEFEFVFSEEELESEDFFSFLADEEPEDVSAKVAAMIPDLKEKIDTLLYSEVIEKKWGDELRTLDAALTQVQEKLDEKEGKADDSMLTSCVQAEERLKQIAKEVEKHIREELIPKLPFPKTAQMENNLNLLLEKILADEAALSLKETIVTDLKDYIRSMLFVMGEEEQAELTENLMGLLNDILDAAYALSDCGFLPSDEMDALLLKAVLFGEVFYDTSLYAVPGNAQKLRIEKEDVGQYYYYYATEDDKEILVYCFNSQDRKWPKSEDTSNDSYEYYVPDPMYHLDDYPGLRDRLFRIFYAGYPANNLNLYSLGGGKQFTESEVLLYMQPTEEMMEALPEIDWEELEFTFERIIAFDSEEFQALNAILSASYEGRLEVSKEFEAVVNALSYADDIEFLIEMVGEMYAWLGGNGQILESVHEAHDATQNALWQILYEAGVPYNKDLTSSGLISEGSLARELIDFANGIGPHADAYVPKRGTIFTDMETYAEAGFMGDNILVNHSGSVSSLTFTQEKNLMWYSDTLSLGSAAYAMPYSIALISADGETLATAHTTGKEPFELVSSKDPGEGASVTISFDSVFPSPVYQYAAISEAEKDLDDRYYQDMSGCYFEPVKATRTFDVKLVPYNPEKTIVHVSKVWVDDDNQKNTRTEYVSVRLYKNEEPTSEVLELSEANKWKGEFANLDKEDETGKEIHYSVKETTPVSNYESQVTSPSNHVFVITNTLNAEVIDIPVEKVWKDADNQDHIRPVQVEVELFIEKSDKSLETTHKKLQLIPEEDWKGTFENLLKDHNGEAIKYVVKENHVPHGYTVSVTEKTKGNPEDGVVVTNTHAVETVSVQGTKTWDDHDNQYDKRPDYLVIRLHANGKEKEVKTVPVAADGSCSWSFDKLPKNEAGSPIVYTITEDLPDGYTAEYHGYDVTNKYTPKTTEITVSKVWEDAHNQDGIRPLEVTIHLFADGVDTGKTLKLHEANEWKDSFEDLPLGVNYTVEEDEVSGYTTTITGTASQGYTVTNTHEVSKISVAGKKTWNMRGYSVTHPDSIVVELHKNNHKIDEKTVTAADGWAWSFDDLDEYENGHLISYSIHEVEMEDYTSNVQGYNIENVYTPGEISISVEKVWNDEDDQDGIRPNAITFDLYENGARTDQHLILTEEDGWSGVFSGLKEYDEDHEKIVYTVRERTPSGYNSHIHKISEDAYTVTNTHEPEITTVKGSKTWVDNDDNDGKRPEYIVIRLHANGKEIQTETITADDNWRWEFPDLPKYEKGEEIHYTITEDIVEDYMPHVNGYNVTNTYEKDKTRVRVTKVWDDNHDQDGKRPENVTIHLYANGNDTKKELVLNESNSWTGSFEELDVYANQKKIVYTVKEDAVSGYSIDYSGDLPIGFIVTNTHSPSRVDIHGSKTWANDKDNTIFRPESLEIHLYANNALYQTKTVTAADGWEWDFTNLPEYENGEKIEYTIHEGHVQDYTPTVDGYNITNTLNEQKTSVEVIKTWNDAGDQDGVRPEEVKVYLYANGEKSNRFVTLNADNFWSDSFTDLPEYSGSKKILYTIVEEAVDKYSSEIIINGVNEYELVNTHVPEEITIRGAKVWDDENDQDGKRPEEITIRLLANGHPIDEKVVTEKDHWGWMFTDLPKYQNGELISYTITEDAVKDYMPKIEGHHVTNTYEPGKTAVAVTKAWVDAENQDGLRPKEVTVRLFANGFLTGKVLKLNQSNAWSGSFLDLDEYRNGKKIEYTVEEDEVDAYVTTYSGDAVTGYIVTNTHTTLTTKVAGTKTWADGNNQDGKRPKELKIRLHANGKEVDAKTVSVDTDGSCSWSFENLPKNAAGSPIIYTITEDLPEGYTAEYHGYNITNKHTPGKTKVTVSKVWNDADDQDGLRPAEVTATLYADGIKTEKVVTLNEKNSWKASIEDLDEYKNGKKITYTVVESPVSGYLTTVENPLPNQFELVNSHVPETTQIQGKKTWKDNENKAGERPDSIVIRLFADGKEVQKAEVQEDEAGDWKWSFENLPKFSGGKQIVYSIKEDAVENYTAKIKGYDVVNTFAPKNISIAVKKLWEDKENEAEKRPEKITIRLFANKKEVKKAEISEGTDGTWTCEFTDLPEYEEGVKIKYTIAEDDVKGYDAVVTGDSSVGFTVTNTYNPQKEKNENRTSSGGSSYGGSGGSSGSSVATGDHTPIMPYVLVLIISALALLGLAYRRRN